MRVMVGSNGGQGSNSAHLRQFNERVILTALRRLGEASKADLARVANLTNNTAGQIVRINGSQPRLTNNSASETPTPITNTLTSSVRQRPRYFPTRNSPRPTGFEKTA